MGRILIIDDDAMVIRMMSFMLKKLGHTAEGAQSGSEGLELIKSQQPGLVLLDVEMPDENGIEVLKKLRLDDKETKVCLMTGTVNDDILAAAREYGAAGCLSKPVEASALAEVLANCGI